MIRQKLIDGVAEQFGQMFSGMRELPGQHELQQQVRAALQGAFSRLDLVTREEFDTQTAVLIRTREKLELLEQKIAELEAQQNPQTEVQEPETKDDAPEA